MVYLGKRGHQWCTWLREDVSGVPGYERTSMVCLAKIRGQWFTWLRLDVSGVPG